MGKVKEQTSLKGLLKIVQTAEEQDDTDISSTCLDIAHIYVDQKKTDEAKKYLHLTIERGNRHQNYDDVVVALRQKANIAIDEEEFADAVYAINEYLKTVEKMSRRDLTQLGYHELCRIHLDWANSGYAQNKFVLLHKAKFYGRKSLEILKNEAHVITRDKDIERSGGTVQLRKTGVNQLMCKIYTALGEHDQARKVAEFFKTLNKDTKEDRMLYFLCIDASLATETDPTRRLELAYRIAELAKPLPKLNYHDALLQRAKESILAAEYQKALLELHDLKSVKPIPGGAKVIDSLMTFAFITLKREKFIQDLNTNYERFKMYEKMGDHAHEHSLVNVEYKFYRKMLDVAEDMGLEEQRFGLQSLAAVLFDLNRYEEAKETYEKLLAVETMLKIPSKGLVDTKISIYRCVFCCGTYSVTEKLKAFENVPQLAITNARKCELLTEMIELLDCFQGDDDVILETCRERYAADLKRYSEMRADEESEEESDPSEEEDVATHRPYPDEFDKCDEDRLWGTVCEFVHGLAEKRDRDLYIENLRKTVNKKVNNNGETQLHLAARGEGDASPLLLLQLGWNVNAQDNGGWTPLTEAINVGHLQNVRMLLEHGADVNLKSLQGLEQTHIHSGVTPLEDACVQGHVAIGKLLLYRNACVTENAVGYLKKYAQKSAKDLTREEKNELDGFLKILTERLIARGKEEPDAGQPLSRSPSPVRRTRQVQPSSSVNPSEGNRNLNAYQRTMEQIGHGRRHHRNTVDAVTLDDDELEREDIKIDLRRSPLREISPLRLGEYSQPTSRSNLTFGTQSSNRSGSHSRSSSRAGGHISDYFDDIESEPRPTKRPKTGINDYFTSPEPKRHSLVSSSGVKSNNSRSPSYASLYSASPCLPQDDPAESFSTSGRIAPSTSLRIRQQDTKPKVSSSPSTSRGAHHNIYKVTVIFEDHKQRKVCPDFNCTIAGTKTIEQLRKNCIRKVTDKCDSVALKYHSVPLFERDVISKSFSSCQTPVVTCEVSGWRTPQLSVLYNRFYPAANQKLFRKVLDSSIGELNFSGSYSLSKDDILNVLNFVKKYSTTPVQIVNFHGLALNADILERMTECFAHCVATMNISSCSLSGVMLRAMCEIVQADRRFLELTELNLRGNILSAKHVDSLLRSCSELSILDLSLVPFQDDVYARCEMLGKTIAGLPYLTELKMRSCGAVEPILSGMSQSSGGLRSLTRLDVTCTDVADVSGIMRCCPSLKYINVSDCEQLKITESFLSVDCVGASKLEEIDISGCCVQLAREKFHSIARSRSNLIIRIEDCEFQAAEPISEREAIVPDPNPIVPNDNPGEEDSDDQDLEELASALS